MRVGQVERCFFFLLFSPNLSFVESLSRSTSKTGCEPSQTEHQDDGPSVGPAFHNSLCHRILYLQPASCCSLLLRPLVQLELNKTTALVHHAWLLSRELPEGFPWGRGGGGGGGGEGL